MGQYHTNGVQLGVIFVQPMWLNCIKLPNPVRLPSLALDIKPLFVCLNATQFNVLERVICFVEVLGHGGPTEFTGFPV